MAHRQALFRSAARALVRRGATQLANVVRVTLGAGRHPFGFILCARVCSSRRGW